MFVKLAILACSVAVTFAAWHGPLAGGKPADLYPAGVSPHACPNYPHCDNPAVAVSAHGAVYGGHGGWNGAQGGAWNGAGYAGAWNGAHNDGQWKGNNGAWSGHNGANNHALYTGEYTGDGDYRGEGLAESGAFGPVHHDNGGYHATPAYAVTYGHHGHAAQYPAGVDPHACPNYPYCH